MKETPADITDSENSNDVYAVRIELQTALFAWQYVLSKNPQDELAKQKIKELELKLCKNPATARTV